jgi:hypothetical protein
LLKLADGVGGRGLKDWHHEDMSVKMLRYLVDDNHLEYDPAELAFVGDLIHGTPPP